LARISVANVANLDMIVTNVLTAAGAATSQMTTIEEVTRTPLVPTNVSARSQIIPTIMLCWRTMPFMSNLSDYTLI
jgi:hypothetical protein